MWPQYNEAINELKYDTAARALELLRTAQLEAYKIYEISERRFATERDMHLASVKANMLNQLREPHPNTSSIEAIYEYNVDYIRKTYDDRQNDAYKLYRARVETALKKYKKMMKVIKLM